jgi:hypothetical protein
MACDRRRARARSAEHTSAMPRCMNGAGWQRHAEPSHPSLAVIPVAAQDAGAIALSLGESTMKKAILATVAAFALVSGAVQSQTAAPATAAPAKAAAVSTDPIVVMRAEQRAARAAFNDATRPIRAERAATVRAAEEKAVAAATKAGTDPLVARRNANRQAMEATRPGFDAKMKTHIDTRRAALNAAQAKHDAALKR